MAFAVWLQDTYICLRAASLWKAISIPADVGMSFLEAEPETETLMKVLSMHLGKGMTGILQCHFLLSQRLHTQSFASQLNSKKSASFN